MKKLIVTVVGLLLMPLAIALPQEVAITEFPLGVGGSVGVEHFKPYFPQLRELAETLNNSPGTQVVITGSADGVSYSNDNDAKNSGLALGRAHALRNILVEEFGVDITRIIIQSFDVEAEGAEFRSVSARIIWEISAIEARIDALENRTPNERIITETIETPVAQTPNEQMGLALGAGLTTTPFGGMPIVSVGVTWKRLVDLEVVAGHTFWDNTFLFDNESLDTKRRLIGARIVVYPFTEKRVGLLAGWMRSEEIAQKFFEYVKLSDGPVLGVRAYPHKYFALTVTFNPAKHRTGGKAESFTKNNQFMISAMVRIQLGGQR
ncbi:MAG: hypothetical protein IIB00_03750 [candidate division Zixibacteria bacterium]|nr:hypothetical protein [candidate division Zixibacteria bacterium]